MIPPKPLRRADQTCRFAVSGPDGCGNCKPTEGQQREHQERVELEGCANMTMEQLMQRPERPATRAEQAGGLVKQTSGIKRTVARIEPEQHGGGRHNDYQGDPQ